MYTATLRWIFSVTLTLTLAQADGVTGSPEPGELLDRYVLNAEYSRSWRLLCDSSSESRRGHDPNRLDLSYRVSDIRSDGERIFWRWQQWGGVVGTEDFVPKEKAKYRSMLWDGHAFSNYRAKGRQEKGIIVFDENPPSREWNSLRTLNTASVLMGRYPNAFERVDRVLRKATAISVRDEMDTINGIACFVMEADTEHGHYTVWIAPEHGYNIAKAEIRATRDEHHLYQGKPTKAVLWVFTLEIHRFQEMDGVWVAMEGRWELLEDNPRRGIYTKKTHTKVTELHLGPDHAFLDSFVRDDVGEGTTGWITPNHHIRRRWQQGEFVPQYDRDEVLRIDQTVMTICGEQQSDPPVSLPKQLKPSEPTLSQDPNEEPLIPETTIVPLEADAGEHSPAAQPASEQQEETNLRRPGQPFPHCGLYCVYTMGRLLDRRMAFADLLKPEYFGSRDGSSLRELRRAAIDSGLYAELGGRLTKLGLQRSPYPAILHVRSHPASPKYDHYELFLGMEKGKAKLYDPPAAPRLVEFGDLMPCWDGRALFVSDHPIDTAAVLAVDRQRWLLYALIGVLAVLAAHLGQRIWLSIVGELPRRWSMGLTAGQAGALGLAALLCGGVYHFANDEGFLANASATQALQEGHAVDFIPKVSAKKVGKLLGGKTVIVDARLTRDYQAGHLEGALSLPIDANDAVWEQTLERIPASARIVTYCQSSGCPYAERVSLRLLEEGRPDVSVFKGGWREWVSKHGRLPLRKLPIQEAKEHHGEPNNAT